MRSHEKFINSSNLETLSVGEWVKFVKTSSMLLTIIVITLVLSSIIIPILLSVKGQVVLPREKTLYIGIVTSSFGVPDYNPFKHAASPGIDLILPFLTYFNFVTNEWIPIVADFKWINDTTLEIKIKPDAKWDDGTPVTADDIRFTFEEAITKRCTDILYWCRGLYTPRSKYIVAWETIDSKTVRLYINATAIRAYRTMPWVFQWIRLAPAHIYKKFVNETDWIKSSFYSKEKGWPVGYGPYKLVLWEPAQVIYERKDDWWGWKYVRELGVRYGILKPGEPYPTDDYPPKYIVFIAIPDADRARAMLVAGELDIINTVLPPYVLQSTPHVGAWFKEPPYYFPYALWAAILQNIVPPLNIVLFKRALYLTLLSYSPDIASRIGLGTHAPVDDPIGLPNAAIYRESPYYDPKYMAETFKEIYGISFPPAKREAAIRAKELIAEAKLPDGTPIFTWDDAKKRFVWNVDPDTLLKYYPGYLDPELRWKVGDVVKVRWLVGLPPSPDDAAMLGVIRSALAEIGVELDIYMSPRSWDDFRIACKGHIHMASYFITFQPGPAPRVIPGQFGFADPDYNRTHTIAQAFPCGKAPPWNPGRYNNTKLTEILREITKIPLTDVENNTKKIRELYKLFLEDMFLIPLTLIPIGSTYSTKYWTGWPTAEKPYATPWYDFMARSRFLTYLLIKPVPPPTTPVVTTVVTTPITIMTTTVLPTTVLRTITAPGTTIVETRVVPTTVVTVIPTTMVTTREVTIVTTATVAVVPTELIATVAIIIIVLVGILAFVLIKRK